MGCPKCTGSFVTRTIADIDIDQCERCGGLWFDKRELRTVLKRGLADVLEDPQGGAFTPVEGDDQPGTCPRCDILLDRQPSIVVEGMSLDVCSNGHGTWLDHGELGHLAGDDGLAAEAGFFSKGL